MNLRQVQLLQILRLSNKPSLSTSKQSYFVFVDGALMTSGVDSIYDIDANKDIVFNVSFNYDSLVVVIDPLSFFNYTRR